jgi:hypothetical protein
LEQAEQAERRGKAERQDKVVLVVPVGRAALVVLQAPVGRAALVVLQAPVGRAALVVLQAPAGRAALVVRAVQAAPESGAADAAVQRRFKNSSAIFAISSVSRPSVTRRWRDISRAMLSTTSV